MGRCERSRPARPTRPGAPSPPPDHGSHRAALPISSVAVSRHATITGVGSSLPPRLVPNTWFEARIDTTDEWIRSRTGIEARHFADDGVVTSDLAVEAALVALRTAGIPAEQLDMIVCASVTGDTPFPATAVWVQEKLGLSCPAFDVNAACAGFSYGLATAAAFVEAGMADAILLIGAEVFSRILDFTDRQTCVLFGDGAGATVIQASERPGIEGTVLGADGTAAEILLLPGGGSREPASAETLAASRHHVQMPNGREVFKRAVTEVAAACRAVALAEAGWTVAIGYRSSEKDAKETIEALSAAGTRGLAVALDVTDEASVHEAFRRVTDEVGNVTGLVNNAGMSRDGLLIKYPL